MGHTIDQRHCYTLDEASCLNVFSMDTRMMSYLLRGVYRPNLVSKLEIENGAIPFTVELLNFNMIMGLFYFN